MYIASRRGCKSRHTRRTTSSPQPWYGITQQQARDCSREGSRSSPETIVDRIIPGIDSPSSNVLAVPLVLTPSCDTQAMAVDQEETLGCIQIGGYKLHTAFSLPSPSSSPWMNPSDTTIDAFYYYSFPAHPFVPPRNHLLQAESAGDTSSTMPALLHAIKWVGSLFINVDPKTRETLFNRAHHLVCNPGAFSDGYLAQAMMLLVIGLDGTGRQEMALQLLGKLEQLALGIGLNKDHFASLHGRGSAIQQESWRRTWWELYVVDAMIAGVHRASGFALFDVETDVKLPCEEHEYLSGVSLSSLHTPKRNSSVT